ncbi:MAG: major capsid protein P2 [Candidatus Omnitrophota bacterium]
MFRQTRKMANVVGIAAGALATGVLPCEGTYYKIFLRALTAAGVGLTSAQILADIGQIRVTVNGEDVVRCQVDHLLMLQKYYWDAEYSTFINGIIPIYFERPRLATDSERSVYALGMQDVKSFTIEVQIDGVAQLATLEVFAYQTPEARLLGQHVRILRFPQVFTTTGEQELLTMPYLNDATKGYIALHVHQGTGAGVVQDLSIKVGGNAIYDRVPAGLAQMEQAQAGRTLQTGYYHADLGICNDFRDGFLPMGGVKDFRQNITWITNAPNNYDIIAEVIHGLQPQKAA